jgi:hypothetical protein
MKENSLENMPSLFLSFEAEGPIILIAILYNLS